MYIHVYIQYVRMYVRTYIMHIRTYVWYVIVLMYGNLILERLRLRSHRENNLIQHIKCLPFHSFPYPFVCLHLSHWLVGVCGVIDIRCLFHYSLCNIRMYIYTYVRMSTRLDVHTYIRTYVSYTCTHKLVCTYIHTYVQLRICMYVHTYSTYVYSPRILCLAYVRTYVCTYVCDNIRKNL